MDHTLRNSAKADDDKPVIRRSIKDEGEQHLTKRMEEEFDRLLTEEPEETIDHKIPSEEMYDQLIKHIHRP